LIDKEEDAAINYRSPPVSQICFLVAKSPFAALFAMLMKLTRDHLFLQLVFAFALTAKSFAHVLAQFCDLPLKSAILKSFQSLFPTQLPEFRQKMLK
jgi:hypothetical protein